MNSTSEVKAVMREDGDLTPGLLDLFEGAAVLKPLLTLATTLWLHGPFWLLL